MSGVGKSVGKLVCVLVGVNSSAPRAVGVGVNVSGVGVEVANLRYFASQSWAFPHSLMIAFTAEYASGDIRCDDSEIAEARWFDVDALPSRPPSLSIARRLIDTVAQSLRET